MPHFRPIGLLLVCAVSSCASQKLDIAGAVLTSGTVLQSGKTTEISHFAVDDVVAQLVFVTWNGNEWGGNMHQVTWQWAREGQTPSFIYRHFVDFRSSPATLRTREHARLLGPGSFRVETLVDGHLVATSHFTIGG